MFHPKDEFRGKYLKALDRQFSAYTNEVICRQAGNDSDALLAKKIEPEIALIFGSSIVITVIFLLIIAI